MKAEEAFVTSDNDNEKDLNDEFSWSMFIMSKYDDIIAQLNKNISTPCVYEDWNSSIIKTYKNTSVIFNEIQTFV